MRFISHIKRTLKGMLKACTERLPHAFRSKRKRLMRHTMNDTASGVAATRRTPPVVVSLTTYGKRLGEVHTAIESIMQGSVKADRIILWLGDELRETPLPETLRRQQTRGLEIRYTADTRSFKKLIPTLASCPDCIIITIDDDVIYPFHLVEDMLACHEQHPDCVCANVILSMQRRADGTFAPIAEWPYLDHAEADCGQLFAEGFGGVLYPPHCFTDEVLNEAAFTSLCPTADDVWLNAMRRVAGRRLCLVAIHPYDYLANVNPDVQDTALYLTNNDSASGNDRQIAAVWDRYSLD